MKTGIELIAEERKRQIEKEGWTEEYDDVTHKDGQLGDAAACYAMTLMSRFSGHFEDVETVNHEVTTTFDRVWPWENNWFKPTPENRIHELVKAGALIVAEIERLQRLENNNSPDQA